jgi:hypothetical protein
MLNRKMTNKLEDKEQINSSVATEKIQSQTLMRLKEIKHR